MKNTSKSIIRKPNIGSSSPGKKLSVSMNPITPSMKSALKLNKTLLSWPQNLEERKKLFDKYSHGRHRFSYQFLKTMIDSEEIFVGISQEVLKKAMKFGDTSNDGFIDRKEFPYFLRNLRYFCDLHKVFVKMDLDKDNRLKRPEFIESRACLDPHMSDHEADRIFKEMDADNGGTVSYDEFCSWALKQNTILTYNNKEYFQELPSERSMMTDSKMLINLEGERSEAGEENKYEDFEENTVLTEDNISEVGDRSKSCEDVVGNVMKQLQEKNAEILKLKGKMLEESGDAGLQDRVRELEEGEKRLKGELEDKMRRIKEINKEKGELEVEVVGLHDDLDVARDKEAVLMKELLELKDKVNKGTINTEMEGIQREKLEWEKRNKELEGEKKKLENKVGSLEGEKKGLLKTIGEKDERFGELEDLKTWLETKHKDLEKKNKGFEETIKTLKERIQEFDSHMEWCRNRDEQFNTLLLEKQKDEELITEIKEKMAGQEKNYKEEINNLESLNRDLNNKISEMETNYKEKTNEIARELETENENLKKKIYENDIKYNETINQKEMENDEKTRKIVVELENIKNDVKKMVSEGNSYFNEKISGLEAKLEEQEIHYKEKMFEVEYKNENLLKEIQNKDQIIDGISLELERERENSKEKIIDFERKMTDEANNFKIQIKVKIEEFLREKEQLIMEFNEKNRELEKVLLEKKGLEEKNSEISFKNKELEEKVLEQQAIFEKKIQEQKAFFEKNLSENNSSAEINNYQLLEKNQEIESLSKEKINLEKKINEFMENNKKQEELITELKHQYETQLEEQKQTFILDKNQSLEEKNQQETQKNLDFDQKLQTKNDEIQQLLSIQSELESIQTNLQDYKQKMSELEEERTKAKHFEDQLKITRNENEENLKKYEELEKIYKEKIEFLEKQSEEFKQTESLKGDEKLTENLKEIEILKTELAVLKQENENLIVSHQRQMEEKTLFFTSKLNEFTVEKSDKISTLFHKIQSESNEKTELQKKLEDTIESLNNLKQENSKLTKELKTSKQNSDNLSEELAKIKLEIQILNLEKEKLKLFESKATETITGETSKMKGLISLLRWKTQSLKKSLQSANTQKKDLVNLMEKLDEKEREVVLLREYQDTHIREISDMKNTIEIQKETINTLNTSELSEKVVLLTEALIRLQQETKTRSPGLKSLGTMNEFELDLTVKQGKLEGRGQEETKKMVLDTKVIKYELEEQGAELKKKERIINELLEKLEKQKDGTNKCVVCRIF